MKRIAKYRATQPAAARRRRQRWWLLDSLLFCGLLGIGFLLFPPRSAAQPEGKKPTGSGWGYSWKRTGDAYIGRLRVRAWSCDLRFRLGSAR